MVQQIEKPRKPVQNKKMAKSAIVGGFQPESIVQTAKSKKSRFSNENAKVTRPNLTLYLNGQNRESILDIRAPMKPLQERFMV